MKVLIVDDNPSIQNMYSRMMQLSDIAAVVIGDGSLVLETALREKPDIILMDIMMPKMNGIEALRILKADEQAKAIPVIMLSAYEEDKLLLEAINTGAVRYLVKSNVEPKQVIEIIREVLANSSGQEQAA